jgi:hypothetical protein
VRTTHYLNNSSSRDTTSKTNCIIQHSTHFRNHNRRSEAEHLKSAWRPSHHPHSRRTTFSPHPGPSSPTKTLQEDANAVAARPQSSLARFPQQAALYVVEDAVALSPCPKPTHRTRQTAITIDQPVQTGYYLTLDENPLVRSI